MQKSALRLTAVDKAADREGLGVGMTLADARARAPQVNVMKADPAADQALLARLLDTCRRYTPALAFSGPDGLDLDLTGCADLFGSEDQILAAVLDRIGRLGLSLRAAVADTPALAWAMARFSGGGICALGMQKAALAPLPIEALQMTPESCAVLDGLGLKRIGQLLSLPRPALARRLGEAALDRLDEALGERADPLVLRLERPPFVTERRLLEPICETDQVMTVVSDLARDISLKLETRKVGGRRFILDLFRMDGAVRHLEICASRPLCAHDRIALLFVERLAGLNEGLEADFGFDHLRLVAQNVQSLGETCVDLLQGDSQTTALGELADRLRARFGVAMRRLQPVDTHRPERAARLVPAELQVNWAQEPPSRIEDAPCRPLRLFDPPQRIAVAAAGLPEGAPARFTWRRVSRTIVRAEGPERIEPEWGWKGAEALARDYYRLEDEQGRRYWVFRQGRHGAGDEPLWRLHGLFG